VKSALQAPPKTASVDVKRQAARVLARLTRSVEKACTDSGLSLSQYRLLLFISLQPQLMSDLASRAQVSRPAITDGVDVLEKLGLLKRSAVEGDRRATNLELTSKGARTLEKAENSILDRLADYLDDKDTAKAIASIGKVLDRRLEEKLRGGHKK
jgi:MarR family transcriptional regulator for hemolysin